MNMKQISIHLIIMEEMLQINREQPDLSAHIAIGQKQMPQLMED